MTIPRWLKDKSPQEKGRIYEKSLAKKLRVPPQPASGALPFRKEDIEYQNFLIQVKSTSKKQYSLKSKDLKDLVRHAVKIGKDPLMVVIMDNRTWEIRPSTLTVGEGG